MDFATLLDQIAACRTVTELGRMWNRTLAARTALPDNQRIAICDAYLGCLTALLHSK